MGRGEEKERRDEEERGEENIFVAAREEGEVNQTEAEQKEQRQGSDIMTWATSNRGRHSCCSSALNRVLESIG